MEIARTTKGISLCQRKYTLDILEDPSQLGAKPALLPIDHNKKLRLNVIS